MASHEIDKLTVRLEGGVGEVSRRQIQAAVTKILEELFDRYFPGERIVEIRRIELDLGHLSPQNLLVELPDRIRYLLKQEFESLQLGGMRFPETEEGEGPSGRTVIQYFREYLRHGTMPGPGRSFAGLFVWLLEHRPEELDRILLESTRLPLIRQRLFFQTPFELLEAYWRSIHPDRFFKISRFNAHWMDILEDAGAGETQLAGARKFLQQSTFEFMFGEKPDASADDYEHLVRSGIRSRSKDGSDGELALRRAMGEDKPPADLKSKSWLALLRFVSTGSLNESAPVETAGLRPHQIVTLAGLIPKASKEAYPVLSRLFSLLRPEQLAVLMATLRQRSGFVSHVPVIAFLDGVLRRSFQVELLDQPRHLVARYLYGAPDARHTQLFFQSVLDWLLVHTGKSWDELSAGIQEVLAMARHRFAADFSRALDFRRQERPVRAEDRVEALREFFLNGRWAFTGTPAAAWERLEKSDEQSLIRLWKDVQGSTEAWWRLIAAHVPMDSMARLFQKIYPKKSSLAMVWEATAGLSPSDARRIWESYARIRAMDKDSDDATVRRLLTGELADRRKRVRESPQAPVRLADLVLPDTGDGWVYIKAFLHWLRFGTFILQDLEKDGTAVALTRIRSHWAELWMDQLYREPAWQELTERFFRLVPVEEQRPWLRVMAPRFEAYWDEWDRLATALGFERSVLLADIVVLETLGSSDVVNDRRLDEVFRRLEALKAGSEVWKNQEYLNLIRGEGAPEQLSGEVLGMLKERFSGPVTAEEWAALGPDEWLQLGVAQEFYPRHTFPELLTEVARKGKLPYWSRTSSPFALESLMYAGSPEIVHRLLLSIFDQPGYAGRFMAALGWEKYLKWLAQADSSLHSWAVGTADRLSRAHAGIGDRIGLVRYFSASLLIEFYLVPNRASAIQRVLDQVPVDFGLPEEDHLTLLVDQGGSFPEVSGFVKAREVGIEIEGSFTEAQQDLDLLIHILRFGQKPWWVKEQPDLPRLVDGLIRSQPLLLLGRLEASGRFREWLTAIMRWGGEEAFENLMRIRFPKGLPSARRLAEQTIRWQPNIDRAGLSAFLLSEYRTVRPDDEPGLFRSLVSHLSAMYRSDEPVVTRALQEGLSDSSMAMIVGADEVAEPDPRRVTETYLSTFTIPRIPGLRVLSRDELIRIVKDHLQRHPEESRDWLKPRLMAPSFRSRITRLAGREIIESIMVLLGGTRIKDLLRFGQLLRDWIFARMGSESAESWDEAFTDRSLYLLSSQASSEWNAGRLASFIWSDWSKSIGVWSGIRRSDWDTTGFPVELIGALSAEIPEGDAGIAKELHEGAVDLRTLAGAGQRLFADEWTSLLFQYQRLVRLLDEPGQRIPRALLDRQFAQMIMDPVSSGKSVRLFMAEFVADVVRRFSVDLAELIGRLREGGYPSYWTDSIAADARLLSDDKQPTPTEAISVRVAYFDASFTLLHYLKTGQWPDHADKTGLDLPGFLEKLSQQRDVDVSQVMSDVRAGLQDVGLRERVVTQEGNPELTSLVRFLFPETRTSVQLFKEWLVPVLVRHGHGTVEQLLVVFHRVLFELASESRSRLWSPDEIREHVLENLNRLLRKKIRLPADDLATGGLSFILIRRLVEKGLVEKESEEEGSEERGLEKKKSEEKERVEIGLPDSATSLVVGGDLSDLLLHLLLEREVPWWASAWSAKWEPSDASLRRLAALVVRIEPEYLIGRVEQLAMPSVAWRLLIPLWDDEDFHRWVAAFNLRRIPAWVIAFDERVRKEWPTVESLTWRSFMVEQLFARPSEFEFVRSSLRHLSLVSGKPPGEWARRLLEGAGVPWSSRDELDRALRSLLAEVAQKEDSPDAMEQVQIPFSGLVRHFMMHGSIPPGQLPAIGSFHDFFRLLREQVGLRNDRIISVLLGSLRVPSVRKRLLLEVREELLALLMRVLFPAVHRELEIQRGVWFRFFRDQRPSITMEKFRHAWYSILLDVYGDQGPVSDGLEEISVQVLRRMRELFKYGQDIGSEVLMRYGVPAAVVNELVRSDVGVLRPAEAPIDRPKDELMEEAISIGNAGLVIVWPFLSRYFELLGMMDKGVFNSEESAVRAVLLLQYVATGAASAPEHELALNKVLCGLPFSTPVPQAIDITEKERQTTVQMLNGVQQNWEKLKNSSIDALREGFLIRDGYLRETEQTWELKVEKKTLDILMQSMPWSVATIKLSWMKKRMQVEWR